MNSKDITNLLKSELNSQIPDVLSRIDIHSIEILDQPKTRWIVALKQRFASITLVLIASSMLIVGIISLQNNPQNPVEVPMTLTAEKTYSFSAISSSALLNSIDLQVSTQDTMVLLSNMMQQETKMKQQLGLLNPYFNMIELFISSGTNLEFTEPVASTIAGYDFQVSYQIINLNLDTATYLFHYKEEVINGEVHTTGILILEQKQFFLEGVKVVNGDQTVITTKTYHDEALKNTHYVEFISTEIQNLQWFEYNVYQSSERTEKSTVYLETIGETIRIRLKYENEISDLQVELKATRMEENGLSKIKAEYEYDDGMYKEKGNILVSVIVDPIQNTNQYFYQVTNINGDKDDYMGGRGHMDYGRDKDDDDEEDDDHGRSDEFKP
jgi:hypothetical protein